MKQHCKQLITTVAPGWLKDDQKGLLLVTKHFTRLGIRNHRPAASFDNAILPSWSSYCSAAPYL